MSGRNIGLQVQLDELARVVLLDMLSNVASMLERGADPLHVAQQIRALIASMEE